MSKPTVRLGSYGPVIRELQRNLNLGTSILAKLKEDGSFGGKTDARVREFQGQSKLTPDGVVGPMTWQALEEFLLKSRKWPARSSSLPTRKQRGNGSATRRC